MTSDKELEKDFIRLKNEVGELAKKHIKEKVPFSVSDTNKILKPFIEIEKGIDKAIKLLKNKQITQ